MTNGKSKILISAAGGKVGQHVLALLAQKHISARAEFTARTRRTPFGKPELTLLSSTSRAQRASVRRSKVSRSCF